MNRPRTKDKDLPQCVYLRRNAYYYVKRGKWLPLGRDFNAAMAKWATLHNAKEGGMAALIERAMPAICENVKPNTKAQYEVAARKLSKMLAEYRPEDVKSKTVAGVMELLIKKPNMANRCLSLLRQVFKYAVKFQLVESNPTIGIDRHAEAKRKRLLTEAELASIYQAAGPRLRVIIDLCIRTGQRISDVLKIRRTDLTDHGIEFTQQKTGAKVLVLWTDELREVVRRAKTLNQNIRAFTLLHNRRGKAPDYRSVKEQWDRACRLAKVSDAHLHDLRALAATHAKRQGMDATALLGHSSQAQTARYLRDRDHVVVESPSFGHPKGLLDTK
jgi:integrase